MCIIWTSAFTESSVFLSLFLSSAEASLYSRMFLMMACKSAMFLSAFLKLDEVSFSFVLDIARNKGECARSTSLLVLITMGIILVPFNDLQASSLRLKLTVWASSQVGGTIFISTSMSRQMILRRDEKCDPPFSFLVLYQCSPPGKDILS